MNLNAQGSGPDGGRGRGGSGNRRQGWQHTAEAAKLARRSRETADGKVRGIVLLLGYPGTAAVGHPPLTDLPARARAAHYLPHV